jgi:predicted DNA-binding protein (MmcQ/YjbR family)
MKVVEQVREVVVPLNKEAIETFALSLEGSEKSFPFDKTTAVYKVYNKMFLLMGENETLQYNVKCDPIYAMELRSIYTDVKPGYHMNKKHWNTVSITGEIPDDIALEFIQDSYDLIISKLTKKQRQELLLNLS